MPPTVTVPNVNDVRSGVIYGSKVGTLKVPPTSVVQQGYGYGANGTEYTGQMIPASLVQLPPPNKVEAGYQYGLNGNQYTGTLVVNTTPNPTPSGKVDANLVSVNGKPVQQTNLLDSNVVQFGGIPITSILASGMINLLMSYA